MEANLPLAASFPKVYPNLLLLTYEIPLANQESNRCRQGIDTMATKSVEETIELRMPYTTAVTFLAQSLTE